MAENNTQISAGTTADNHEDLRREKVDRKVRRDRIFLNNPVIMQGIGLAPLIVAATSGYNSLVLAVGIIMLLTPTRILSAILSRITPIRFRGPAYLLCAALVYIPTYYVVTTTFEPATIIQVGLYLPLLVFDPIILKRYERVQNESLDKALSKGLITTIGYCLVLMLLGCLRELIGAGTLFNITIFSVAPLPIALLPAGGFIILAIVMAVWRSVVGVVKGSMIIVEEDV